jgi:hypothetical protein
MARRSDKYFDEKILNCIYATLESEEIDAAAAAAADADADDAAAAADTDAAAAADADADADADSKLYDIFDKCMSVIVSEIVRENKERVNTKIPKYNMNKEIIKLFESAIILDPTISKEKKALLMRSFDIFNTEMLTGLNKEYQETLRSSNSKLFNIPKETIETLRSNLNQQKLYNEEYTKSFQDQTITPKLLELLVSFKKHDPKFVEEYSGDTKSIVNDWISQDSATIAANTDNPDNLPISLMNEVDGGRKKRKRQSKKSKHSRFIKKSRKMRKSRKSRKSKKSRK